MSTGYPSPVPNSASDHSPQQEHPWVAVDVLLFTVTDNALETLLVRVKKGPFINQWAFPGGLVALDESLDNAAQRELEEKTSIREVYLEQLFTFGSIDRNPTARVVSTAYFALLPAPRPIPQHGSKYSRADWFPVSSLPHLAYDHDEVARIALERLRSKISYTSVAYSLLPKEFTMTELQRVYEILLDRRLDRRNFRKKLLSTGLLRALPTKRRGAHRPAALYKFYDRRPMPMDLF